MEKERTLILAKPDSVARCIVGNIISRFENTGLKIVGMKMHWPSQELVEEHYELEEEWAKNLYNKTKEVHDKLGKELKYKDHMDLGETIQGWNRSFLAEGPVIALVLEGPNAVEIGRKLAGHTEPRQAAPGTIRGDFRSVESYSLADLKKRSVRNLIHASDTVENANREISLWFKKDELFDHKTIHSLESLNN